MSPAARERIRTQVRESRQRQGLGPHITDTALLDRLAGRLLEREAEPVELVAADSTPER